jgi:3'(2'), 5'-bisphosphate nucleotidase
MTKYDDKDAIALTFANLCSVAGAAIMQIYATDFTTRSKDDTSPVTDADEVAEKIILEGLAEAFPDLAVLAEESFAAGFRPVVGSAFILVDPIDGTKEFINRNGEFTVNIALIENQRPIAGCVYAPARERIYLGGEHAYAGPLKAGEPVSYERLDRIETRECTAADRTAVMSRSHADQQTLDFADKHGVTDRISAGSSLKFCLLAEGRADIYPRFGPTREWDTGAGHAVLNAAGGVVLTPEGEDFLYAKEDTEYLNGFFVAWAHKPD